MGNEHFLYETLYQSLLADISVGNLKYGDKLPSQKEICERYNVGTAVVRGALRKLEQESYVSISQGKRASVIFKNDGCLYTHTLLKRKHAIIDALDGMTLLIPPIFEACARLDSAGYGATLEQILAFFPINRKKQATAASLSMAYSLLSPLNNPLLYDLQMEFQLFTRIPDLCQQTSAGFVEQYSAGLQGYTQQSLRLLHDGLFDDLRELIVKVFHHLLAHTVQFLDRLDSGQPSVNRDEVPFSWSADKGGKLYSRVALNLIKQIMFGEYQQGDYLPSFSEITRLYGVAPVTARSAYAVLDSFGVVETVSGLGTRVAFQGPLSNGEILRDEVLRQRLLRFLDSAQIFALTIKKIALLAFPSLSKERIEQTHALYHRKPFQEFTSNALGIFLVLLRDNIPCKSVVTVYDQLTELLFWGYYLQRVEGIGETVKTAYGLCGQVLSALLSGDAQAFACELERTFYTNYILYWDIAAELGLDRAQMPNRLTTLARRLGCPVALDRDARPAAV